MKKLVVVGLLCLAPLGLACQSNKSGTAKAKAEALASSTPNAQAVNTVKADVNKCMESVPTLKLATSAGRQKVGTCLSTVLTPTQKQALEQCITDAALHDHLLTKPGRLKFESQDVGGCIDKVTAHSPAVHATPTK